MVFPFSEGKPLLAIPKHLVPWHHPAGIVGSGSGANSSPPTWEDIRDLEDDRDSKQGAWEISTLW